MVEDDHGGYSCLKVGDFEIVVYHDTLEWFVNLNDETGDIDLFRFIEGESDSVEEAKKEALQCMTKLVRSFMEYDFFSRNPPKEIA